MYVHKQSYMNDQSLRQGKANQLHLKTTPIFSREKEELPQAGFEPAMFCVPRRCSTNEPPRQLSWAGRIFNYYAKAQLSLP